MERVWRRVQSAGRRGGTVRCGCPVQPCQLHVDQRAKRGGGGRKSRGGPQTIVCGCQVQPCPVHPVLIRVRRARPAVGNCDCPLESQPCPHVSRSSAVRRVRRCECPERPCRHTAPSSGTRRRVQMQASSPTFPPSSQPNQQQQPCDCTERVDCTHTGGGEGTCDCECGEDAKPCSHTVKQRRSRRTCDCSGSSSQPCSHKPQHEGRIKRVKCRVRRAGCAMARCTAELAMLHLHWGLATECAPCRPRALTRRLCRRQQSDNELYRSNSFKFERFERTKDECATPLRKQADPLSPHLFNLEVERWRPLRTKLTPVFTSGKLKEMFYLILECANNLEEYLEKMVAKGEPVDCRELTGKYTTDVIGSCAFGIETDALGDNESEFRRMGRKVFAASFFKLFRLRVSEATPWLYNLLGYVLPLEDTTTFFTKVLMGTMHYRTKNNVVRPDFVNTLLELKKHPDKLENIKVTDTFLTAQAYIFFIAGFETSSTTMSNALYELALNTDVQDKLRKEIGEHYAKNNGELTYEQVKGMTYLDLVFRETLRKYPAVPSLQRISTCDYTFHGTKVTIPKNTFLVIPVFAIHRDANVYPNPDAFIPERFNVDAVAARNPMHYIPFGDGPRNCIAARFASYQAKVGLIKILCNHKVEVCEKTMIPYVMHTALFLLTPKEGIHLKITKVEN